MGAIIMGHCNLEAAAKEACSATNPSAALFVFAAVKEQATVHVLDRHAAPHMALKMGGGKTNCTSC